MTSKPPSKKKGQNNVNNKNVEQTVLRPSNVLQNVNQPRLLPSRFNQPYVKPKFVGSLSILHAVVDSINRKIFCNNLDDIELEWCDKLTTRKAVTYKIMTLTTTKTYIRLSQILFENASRKQLVESVTYELLHLYLTSQARTEENDLQVYLLGCGIRYLNESFELGLKINHNFDVVRSGGGKKENINVPVPSHNDINETQQLIELLGGSAVEFIPVSSKRNPIVRIINTKLIVKNQEQFKCKMNCEICHCGPQLIMRERYLGAKIYYYSFFTIKPDTFECILCECQVERRKLNKHLDNDCVVFKVSQIIHDKLNV